MGTPHQGGNGVEMAQVILTVAGVFMQTNPMLLKSLGPGSKELQELNREYFDVANKRQFDTILCYEDRKTVPLWNGPKVWVSRCAPESRLPILIIIGCTPILCDDATAELELDGDQCGPSWYGQVSRQRGQELPESERVSPVYGRFYCRRSSHGSG